MTILIHEARDEADRLSKVLGQEIEVAPITCTCDYSKLCYRCGGEGIYYEPVYKTCSHTVKETDYDGCSECEEEGLPVVLRAESAPIKSCFEVASEEAA